MRTQILSKLNKSLLLLHDSLSCDKLMGNGISEVFDNEHMREFKRDVEEKIIQEVHPYKIYESGSVSGQWITHLPDESRPEGRRKIKRNSYERLCQAVISFYKEQYHLDLSMDELFSEWAIFRRDETSTKDGTIRKDVGLWRKYISSASVGKKRLGSLKVTEITPKLLYQYFRKLTKDREFSRQSVYNIRGVLSGMLSYAVEREIIETNPAKDVDLRHLSFKPSCKKTDSVFSFEDAQKLLDYLRTLPPDPYVLAIRLDFNLFIRVGEIAGLRWDNVDLENRVVHICNQITYEPTLNDDMSFSSKIMVTEDYLKGCTDQGYRDEYLTDDAIEVLKTAREINPDGEFVFMPFGKPLITTTFNKRLKRYCDEVGIKYHSSHKI